MELNGIPKENLEVPKDAIPIYDVKVGDRFYYASPRSQSVDIAEIRKIDMWNGHQRIFVRTFITNKNGEIIDKHSPVNPWYLWPEQKDVGIWGQFLFRTVEEAFQYNVECFKKTIDNEIKSFKRTAKRYNIQLLDGSYLKQLEAPNNQ